MYAHVCVSVCLCMCMLVRVGDCQLISRIRVSYAELKTSPSVTPERRRFVRQSKRVSKTAPAVTASRELRTTIFWWNYFNYYFLCNYVCCCCNYYSYYCCNTRNSCCVVTAAQRKEAKLLHRQESIVTIPTSRRPFVPWRGLWGGLESMDKDKRTSDDDKLNVEGLQWCWRCHSSLKEAVAYDNSDTNNGVGIEKIIVV